MATSQVSMEQAIRDAVSMVRGRAELLHGLLSRRPASWNADDNTPIYERLRLVTDHAAGAGQGDPGEVREAADFLLSVLFQPIADGDGAESTGFSYAAHRFAKTPLGRALMLGSMAGKDELTSLEASVLLGRSAEHTSRMAAAGTIPARQGPGGQYVFEREAVKKFLLQRDGAPLFP